MPTVPFLHQRSSSAGPGGSGVRTGQGKKKKFRRSWANRGKADYNFSTENDIRGIVMLEIRGATDLPCLENSWDIDPSSSPSAKKYCAAASSDTPSTQSGTKSSSSTSVSTRPRSKYSSPSSTRINSRVMTTWGTRVLEWRSWWRARRGGKRR